MRKIDYEDIFEDIPEAPLVIVITGTITIPFVTIVS
jgi:hypothetical protein